MRPQRPAPSGRQSPSPEDFSTAPSQFSQIGGEGCTGALFRLFSSLWSCTGMQGTHPTQTLVRCVCSPGARIPVSSICNNNARNLSFHARSPKMGKCLCNRERTQTGQKELTRVLSGEGEKARSPATRGAAGLFTRARLCPRAHSSTGIWLASAFARPAPPMPGKETDAISISDYQIFRARLPQSWPVYTRSPNLPSLPPYTRSPSISFFY